MAQVTVKQLAEVVGTPVERLLEQLKEAGLTANAAEDSISDDEKLKLLDHLRANHGKNKSALEKPAGGKRITLKRKSVSELKVSGSSGRAKTVNVEVRKKRTFARPAETIETATMPAAVPKELEALEKLKVEKVRREEERQRELEVSREREEKRKDEVAKEEQEAREKAEKKALAESDKPKAPGKTEQQPTPPPAAEDSKGRRKASKKPRFDKKGDTHYGRKELHVASDKSGKRKKKKHIKHHVVDSTSKHGFELPVAPIVHEIDIPETITVGDLAQKMTMKSSDLIKVLMKLGVMATINQVIDQDTATLVVEEVGHIARPVGSDDEEKALLQQEESTAELHLRPPVVTIMGHVDHGKTSLLDYIRHSKIASGEVGGITQHIGAYHVASDNGVITFLDTPGHAAFTAMRERGANATDIVIIVVAADDGVMPQTIEAIQHSKAAGVPLIIAVNKIDKEDADPEKVKTELGNHEVIPEEWGGDNIFVNVSAQTGEGVDKLLEAILLQAELLELKSPIDCPASGVVLEASLDKGRGVMATVLVRQGTLKQGDMLLAGQEFGRIRAMYDENGKQINSAGPAIPVVVQGLSATPSAGDDTLVLADERKAREVAQMRKDKSRKVRLASQQQTKMESLFDNIGSNAVKKLNVMLKTDVQGSMEAIRDALTKITEDNDEVSVNIVGSGVGGINETDISLASASDAIVIGFNVRADAAARRAVSERGVELNYYSIIYELIDDITSSLTGMLPPEFKEQIIGLAEVKDVFRSPKFGAVAGSIVTEGVVRKSQPIRVLRENVVIYEGELESLRRFKDDVENVQSGTECGIAVKNYNDVKVGDQIEVFEKVRVERTL